MKLLLLITVPLVLVSCHQHISSQLDKTASQNVKVFFNEAIRISPRKAAIDLLSQNHNINLKDSAAINLVNSLERIYENAGSFVDYTFYKTRTITDYLGAYSYLARFKQRCYRFVFTFYDNGKDIKIFKISFDDTVEDDLADAVKM